MNYRRAMLAINFVAAVAALGLIYGFLRLTCWVIT